MGCSGKWRICVPAWARAGDMRERQAMERRGWGAQRGRQTDRRQIGSDEKRQMQPRDERHHQGHGPNGIAKGSARQGDALEFVEHGDLRDRVLVSC